MSMTRLFTIASLVLTFGCKGDEYAYCIGVVPDDADGSAPAFDDDELAGVEICTSMYRFGMCEDLGGSAVVVEDQEGKLANGVEFYCPDQGFTADCGSQVYVENEEDCP